MDRRRWWLWLFIALVLLAGFNGQWRIGPDSAVHVEVARNLVEGSGFTHPTGLESTIRPGLAWLTASTFRLFGIDHFIAIDLLMLLSMAAVLVLTYWTIQLRFDRPTAVIVICMLALNETFYRYGYQVLTDMPFLLGLMLLLLGLELLQRGSKQRLFALVAITVAVLIMVFFRSVVIIVAVAGLLAALYHILKVSDAKTRTRYITFAGLFVIGLLIVTWLIGGASLIRDGGKALSLIDNNLGDTFTRILTDNGPSLIGEHLSESMLGFDPGLWLGLPLGILILIVGISLFRYRPIWGLLIGIFVMQWLLLITTERYLLVIMPLLTLSWWLLLRWCDAHIKQPAHARWAVAGLLLLWFAPNLAEISVFVAEQRARPFIQHYQDGRYLSVHAVANELKQVAEDGDFIIADNAPQLTYFSRLPVYGQAGLPTYGSERDTTAELLRQADRILLVEPTSEKLSLRIEQLKMQKLDVIRDVPPADMQDAPAYQITQMRARNVNWENYHKRLQKRLDRARATEQGDSEPEEQTR